MAWSVIDDQTYPESCASLTCCDESTLFIMTVCDEVGLSCLSGLSDAGPSSDPDNSPFNIHNSQLSESRLGAAACR
jgi:hypothetical protein